MKTKICVVRNTLGAGAEPVTGVFEYKGTSWRTAVLTKLVKQLPADISDKELQREYREEVRRRKQQAVV